MKRLIVLIFAISAAIAVKSQNIDDALRYSQVFYNGTARFMSMGGAFTALGADLSTFSQNPAGIGLFRSSEIAITPQLNYVKTTSSYNGSISTEYLDNFNLSQAGFVSSMYAGGKKSGLVAFNFGYSFNKTNNLNQSMIIEGINQESSMADYWAGNSQGVYYKDLGGVEAIVFDAYVIDTLPGSDGMFYGTALSNGYGQSLRRLIYYDGYTGEHAISFGGNYSDKFYFGATFGITQLRYDNHYEHVESTNSLPASGFKNFNYIDHFEHSGVGFGFKLGAIVRPVEMLRIGVAFHSPTWFTIDEYFWESISSRFVDKGPYDYVTEPLRYEFALATPYRFLAGAAVQIQKIAIISADYEYANYGNARFSQTGDGYNYTEKNNIIKSSLQATNNFRLGGELRLNKVYLRSGYGYYGKPYKNTEDNADLDYRTISGGIGFREKNVSIDFGYTNYKNSQVYFLYPVDNNVDPADANLATTKNVFNLTLGFKF